MPLSEYEQRVLDELERDLGTDPKLKSALAHPHRSATRLLIAAIGVVAGLGVVLSGVMQQNLIVGILGFALMTTSALWAIAGSHAPRAVPAGDKKGARTKPRRQGFMNRLEERFEKRREQGDL
jgi:hypothetical protein